MSRSLFRAEHVSKAYAGHVALSDVSISVNEGSIFGLMGPNGAGKTSLIRIINQITAPDTGELWFGNERLEQKHLQHIGYLPEERGLYKKMKVGEQALYLCQLKGLSKRDALQRLKFWFEKFEIQEWWNKKVEELSKGMAQKVQFIVTVLHDPKLLILDEPFSGFDPINTNLIKSEILELRKKGTTIIFSTHNMGSVEELCDHIALIHNSVVILEGDVSEVRNRFRSHEYQVQFSGDIKAFATALGTYGELLNHASDDRLISAHVRLVNGASTNDLLGNVMRSVQIQGFQESIPSMNDIFIRVVEDSTMDVPIPIL
ncbi:MAG: ATP-binding cassette domain-containing protein [Flavobacteriales bacterium]|nr:ATP-binding cassette domain-containing protein [Flavobacteriales bacterium]